MLVPAMLYREEIIRRLMEYTYTDDMMYYSGYLGNSLPLIQEETDGSAYQYAIVDKDNKLIGYFAYRIDWYNSCARSFGLFSFDRNNIIIGLDIRREIKKIIDEYHIHRIEWRMIGGNPVERHYDNFCNKYNGKKFIFTDALKDRCGNYHNDVIYEIIFDGGENND